VTVGHEPVVDEHEDEKAFNKFEHEQYKKHYKDYQKRLFQFKKQTIEKVIGKREYDESPEAFNEQLNSLILSLNEELSAEIQRKDFSSIEYNETQFNNLSELTYGHDGLLKIACLLVSEFQLLRKILADKYDYIFIDEYQDTAPDVISMFIENVSKDGPVIGLFGDSVQAIYSDGVGDVNHYIQSNEIIKIEKEDNYRCSAQVIEFANRIRYDGLSQEVALKTKADGELETIADRQGTVELYYAFVDTKPHARSSQEDKTEYQKKLDFVIAQANEGDEEYKALKLTNKSIAHDAGFPTLFEIFDERYLEVKDEIERKLVLWQFQSLFELCDAYQPFSNDPEARPNYNDVISRLKRNGFELKTIEDKKRIQTNIQEIIESEEGAFATLEKAFKSGLLKKAESNENFSSGLHHPFNFPDNLLHSRRIGV